MLHQPFPAEHPYASHQSKFAVFPKFDTPGDPQRGVKARSEMPLNDEMPANPYDVVVVKKTKGKEILIQLPEQFMEVHVIKI